MTLTLHDTYAKKKRAFEPADPSRVTLYVCGPTVYNYAHIGNARPVVVFDVLFRLLRRLYGEGHVVYARNITDVDDRIAEASIAQGVEPSAITDPFTAVYQSDMAALNCLAPSIEPRATDHVAQMIDMITRLVERGHAYATQGGVMFDVASFADYGKLSGRTLADLRAGARVEVADYKRDPADFTLWKPSKPGEPVWDSPWGPGRPGWHIECSAMIQAKLGLPIDIHGGGHDLIFPHHENEIAQGVCAHGTQAAGEAGYARYWMHNGFLTLDAEKMSKSLGNVLLVHDLLAKVPGEVIRWALLSAHYRAPLDWTGALIEQARRSLDRLHQTLSDAGRALTGADASILGLGDREARAVREQVDGFAENILGDDLNTPQAMSFLFEQSDLTRRAIQARDLPGVAFHRAVLMGAAELMGVLQADPDAWFQGAADDGLKTRIEALIASRVEARKAKDWAEADRIRTELTKLGVEVLDGAGGAATWRLREG